MLSNNFIIVPCYNERFRFPLSSFENFFSNNYGYSFCFVNDGSTDGTREMLDLLCNNYPNICVLHIKNNLGKGEAVRKGVNYVLENFSPTYVGYLDADLSVSFEEVKRIFVLISKQAELSFVFGSRVSVFGSKIQRLGYRHYGGRIIATMIDQVLKLSIYDTQCGFKILHHSLARKIFKDPFISRWLFDAEIFLKVKEIYSRKDLEIIMKEIPLNEWIDKGGSKVSFLYLFKIPYLLFAIRNKYKST